MATIVQWIQHSFILVFHSPFLKNQESKLLWIKKKIGLMLQKFAIPIPHKNLKSPIGKRNSQLGDGFYNLIYPNIVLALSSNPRYRASHKSPNMSTNWSNSLLVRHPPVPNGKTMQLDYRLRCQATTHRACRVSSSPVEPNGHPSRVRIPENQFSPEMKLCPNTDWSSSYMHLALLPAPCSPP